MRGRSSGEAAKGTHKRSLWAVPLDEIVSGIRHETTIRPMIFWIEPSGMYLCWANRCFKKFFGFNFE